MLYFYQTSKNFIFLDDCIKMFMFNVTFFRILFSFFHIFNILCAYFTIFFFFFLYINRRPIYLLIIIIINEYQTCYAVDKRRPFFQRADQSGILFATFAPAAEGHHKFHARMRVPETGEILETVFIHIDLTTKYRETRDRYVIIYTRHMKI